MQIEVEVKGQQIKLLNSPGSVEGTLNYLTCHFVFEGEEWGNTVKMAYFRNPASGEKYQKILADDGTCTVPWEALTDKGFVRFSVAGEREHYRITTNMESFYNSETVYGGQPSEPPTPDQYDQLIALAQETKEIAESVREDADAGEFDGPPGPQGPKGENGDTGPRGPAGKDGQNATDEQVRTAVDAYMEENPIQADTEDIIKLAIKNEASGAVPISITDSADMGVQDLEMQGWTEQAQYEGKNLFSIDDFDSNNKATIQNGTILFNQSRGAVTYNLNLGPGAYSISIARDGYSGINIKINEVAVINNGSGNNYTGNFDVSDGDSVVLEFSKGQNPNGEDRIIYDIMLNSGSTALPYEPYTGGQPSPNPDYPQPITSAGNRNEKTQKWEHEVKLQGKNLFNAEYFKVSENWKQPETSGYSYIPIFVGKGNTITISTSGNPVLGLGFYCAIAKYDYETSNKVYKWIYHSTQSTLINTNATFVVTESDYIYFSLNSGSEGILKFLEAFPNFQIEISAQRTDFQPYKEQTVTLTSDRPLTKWDRLEKRNGQWGWVYKSAEIVLDGSEDEAWSNYSNYNGFLCSGVLDETYTRTAGMCNQGVVDQSGSIGTPNTIWLGGNTATIYWINNNYYDSGLEDEGLQNLKDHLSQIPVVIWYETESETFVPLSESEQEQMNALYTYYPTTVLSNDTECEMSIKYIADIKTYIDSKIAAIQAAIVNTI